MSECKHRVVWKYSYFCSECNKSLIELYDEQDAALAALKQENADLLFRIKTLDACYQKALKDIVKSSQSLAAAELREKVVRFIYLADHFAFQTEPPDPHAEGEGCRDCDYRREIEDAAKQYNVAEYAEQLLGGEK